MYLEHYKACHTLFEAIPRLDMGGVFVRGPWLKNLQLESEVYHFNSSDSLVKKYLPGAFSLNEKDAFDKINGYIDRFILKSCIPFIIATKEMSVPIGYILCHSPLVSYKGSKERINDWTIDFWLGPAYRGQGIMETVLYNVIGYLQIKEVDRVYMFVDKDNYPSIHIIEKCTSVLVGESGDGKLYKYGVKLKNGISI